jgi:hypothetical protein
MTVMSAVMTRTAGSAAFKAGAAPWASSAISAAIIGTSAAAVRPAATSAIAVSAATAERTLKARTWIAADAR